MPFTLDELINNRKELVSIHKKNNFTDGIHSLLTDLYPDTAHFIFELLQNAEDMNATTVRFILEKDCVSFEHNGTKRNFNLDDIDAITNIGYNKQKKDDVNSIGEFGVGFKAVFAYTSTPEIHSGDYHFIIRNYFVPDFDNVKKLRTIDANGTSWTRFSFPFNNPNKTAEDAYNEILFGLQQLDETSILFLNNISLIEYLLPNGGLGLIERKKDPNTHILQIKHKKYNADEKESYFLYFSKPINHINSKGCNKQLSVAIAYRLKKENDTETYKVSYKIVPAKEKGKTFIYFPTEKEYSGLNFYINAPFSATVARDSIKDCTENRNLIKEVAKLVANSISEIKRLGYLNYSFFAVLPNEKDGLSPFYSYILDFVYSAFAENKYIPMLNSLNEYTESTNALVVSSVFSKALSQEDYNEIMGTNKNYVSYPLRNSRADDFLKDIGIERKETSDFTNLFMTPYKEKFEKFVLTKDLFWLKNFYNSCAQIYNSLGTAEQNKFSALLRNCRFIIDSKNNFYKAGEIYLLPYKYEQKVTLPVVHPTIFINEKNMTGFFVNVLQVKEYGERAIIENLLKKCESNTSKDDDYFKDMLAFAKYFNNNPSPAGDNYIDFAKYKIFYYGNEGLQKEKASSLVLDKRYHNKSGGVLSEVYNKPRLWNGYEKHYTKDELSLFINFAINCGIMVTPFIEECDVKSNPLFYKELLIGDRKTKYERGKDYTINELDKLLSYNSVRISLLIWDVLKKVKDEPLYKRDFINYWYTKAYYQANASVEKTFCDSTLIYTLKNTAWLPDKNGNFYKPCDIKIENLHPKFQYDIHNETLTALEIGSSFTEQAKKIQEAERAAKEAGKFLIDEDDHELLRKTKEKLQRTTAKQERGFVSMEELLNSQNKENKDMPINTNYLPQVINVEKTIVESMYKKNIEFKLFSLVSTSSKREKQALERWYFGKCQMCGTKILTYKNRPYFIAKNIIPTNILPGNLRQTIDIGWNSLCLCPNCSAKYDVCSRSLSTLYQQIIDNKTIDAKETTVNLRIILDGDEQKISYTHEHFNALKTAVLTIDKEGLYNYYSADNTQKKYIL